VFRGLKAPAPSAGRETIISRSVRRP